MKLGVLVAALLVALTLLGAGYAKWSDLDKVNGAVAIGTVVTEIIPDSGSDASIDIQREYLSEPNSPLIIGVHNPGQGTHYATFSLKNQGTLPVAVQTACIDDSAVPEGVSVALSGIAEGNTLNAGITKNCQVTITNNSAPPEETDFNITLTIEFIQWNLYVAP